MQRKIRSTPWDEWANRVIIHVPHYLSYEGQDTAGGRQRKVRDISRLIAQRWGRQVVIAQKARVGFETEDRNGIPVVGLKAPLGIAGDSIFAYKSSRLLQADDAFLTIGQEDGWPFFVENSKGMHTGVWWDGPHSRISQWGNRVRVMAMMRAVRSMWSVDTNIINWIRAQGREGYALASKCFYSPNCVSLKDLRPRAPQQGSGPLRILFARRYEQKRGGKLFLEGMAQLRRAGIPFFATLCAAKGHDSSRRAQEDVASLGLEESVRVAHHDMDQILAEYSEHDLAIVPTLWSEGTSYACIEAIAAGVPVVVTPVGGLGNLVVPEYNGKFMQPSSDSLAKVIINLVEEGSLEAMARNCLSMREAFCKERWDDRFLRWVKS